jgi:pimeloyl-ACP methyl ester carboxylesterase
MGQRIDGGNRRLWLHHSGEGEPAVTFVAGGGAMGLDYLLSQQQVAELTSCLIYDRAGTGWSEDADLPRSAEEVTDELHDLLQLVGMQPPHILVGHSLGGAYVHRYAQRFPTEIAGLLLVEPAHPDWDSYMPEHLTLAANQTSDMAIPDFSDQLVTLARGQFEGGMFDAFSENIRELLIGRHLSRERLLVGIREGLNVLSVMDELCAGGPLPDVPLIVLSGTAIGPEQTVFQTEDNLRAQIAGSQRLFDAIAASVSHGEHRSLSDASHVSLPMTRPDAIAMAVNDLLHQFRATGSPSRWPLNPMAQTRLRRC